MLNFKKRAIFIIFIIFIVFFSFPHVFSEENTSSKNISISNNDSIQKTINNSVENSIVELEPGIYVESGIIINKNITIIGKGSRGDVIIDGNHSNTIFIISTNKVHVNFINITFINGISSGHGGAIHSEAGNLYVDNCVFINNTASENGGAIDNYGGETIGGYLFVNNSLFIGNYAGHDGGAITTYRGNTDIFNSIFINNSAKRDGGAIRGGLYTKTNIYNCTFDNNYAEEWGGAVYIWTSNSSIKNSTFINNNAGTYGGAILTSGETIVKGSIFANNSAKYGGLVYIVQKLQYTPLKIVFNNNLIFNNSATYGGDDVYMGNAIYVPYSPLNIINFENNNWGTDNPNWAKRFFTNNFTNFPINWIKSTGNILNPNNNNTYQENGDQIDNSFDKSLEGIFDSIVKNYLKNNNIGSNNTDPKSPGIDSSKAQNQEVYELNIIDEVKKIYNNDFINYIIAIILIVAIVIGYKQFK